MPKYRRIQFSATIQAPVATVWETMLGAETYKRWTEPFVEGSHYEGSWNEGSRIKFLTPSGEGMVSEIAENRLHELISIRHVGTVSEGVEDTESEAVRAWAPAYENYGFEAVPEGTKVVIDQDVTDEFEQSMRDTWPKALEVLKGLCESEVSQGRRG